MPRSDANQITALIDQFVGELTQAFEAEATERARAAALAAFAGARTPSPMRALPSARRGITSAADTAPAARSRSTRGQKRDPGIIAAMTEKLAAHIAKRPGQGMEEITKALGVALKDLALPVKRLVAAKRITTKGRRRGMKYFPATAAVAGGRKAKEKSPRAVRATAKAHAKAPRRRPAKAKKIARKTAQPRTTAKKTPAKSARKTGRNLSAQKRGPRTPAKVRPAPTIVKQSVAAKAAATEAEQPVAAATA
jgi:hypothetical protein